MSALTPGQRRKRVAVLADQEHACWYCGYHAEQMSWDDDGTAVCRSCYVTLARADPDDVPTNATRVEKRHYLRTMTLLRQRTVPQRPRFTTAMIKSRYPIPTRLPEPANLSKLEQKRRQRRLDTNAKDMA